MLLLQRFVIENNNPLLFSDRDYLFFVGHLKLLTVSFQYNKAVENPKSTPRSSFIIFFQKLTLS